MQGSKLYVGNFVYATTDEQLIVEVNIIGNKGFGFVEMSSSEEAEAAKEALDGTEIDGRTLRVDEARPKKPRY